MTLDAIDDAYARLATTGPEFDGWLSNHGPMAAEALARHDTDVDLSSWLDRYTRRLEPTPGPSARIDDWAAALGDPRRLGDWLGWFEEEAATRPWTDVLGAWWPRLVPGIAAGATHGVIRVGHAVRVLRELGETPERVAELGRGLAYWSARWQPVPGATGPRGRLDAATAISALPAITPQTGGIQKRLRRLAVLDGWAAAQSAIAPSADAEQFLRDLVIAAVRRYATHAHGNPVMLVHAATAPNAVLRTLPSLAPGLWAGSVEAAWSASAAIVAAYAPSSGRQVPPWRSEPAVLFDRAAHHGDEHVIKLADTALDAYAWSGDVDTLRAVETAIALIDPL
ncbi:hypothetical protein [Nocardioides sp.]|uniref:hypothetical protein n=1 Tax=Nocardioides sp. TaxID=35761 RepID=UPI002602DBF3|nr:hypothetical protein [Nocardioides sp.]